MKSEILPIDFPGIEERIYAGFWRRFGAFWLDFLITAPITFGIVYINNLGRLNTIYTIIPSYAFFFIYHIYFVKLWGATPGKIITKIKIIRIDGLSVDWKEAILRHVIQLVLGIFAAIALTIPVITMTDAEFASMGFMDRSRQIVQSAPSWYNIVHWANQIWIWSEFLVLLLNKRKRALHDFVAGTVVIKKKYGKLAEQRHSL
jgi:uncharacterized RDD family membrane protein YckC